MRSAQANGGHTDDRVPTLASELNSRASDCLTCVGGMGEGAAPREDELDVVSIGARVSVSALAWIAEHIIKHRRHRKKCVFVRSAVPNELPTLVLLFQAWTGRAGRFPRRTE